MSREADLAWCAGFFDGEGHVSYRRSYPSQKSRVVSPALHASVPQASSNIEVLEHFQSIIEMGRIKGPYKMPSGRNQHRLLFGVDEVEKLFILLKSNLRSDKTRDFQIAIMSYHSHDTRPTSDDWTRLIAHNKKKGCNICKFNWNGLACAKCGYIW